MLEVDQLISRVNFPEGLQQGQKCVVIPNGHAHTEYVLALFRRFTASMHKDAPVHVINVHSWKRTILP